MVPVSVPVPLDRTPPEFVLVEVSPAPVSVLGGRALVAGGVSWFVVLEP